MGKQHVALDKKPRQLAGFRRENRLGACSKWSIAGLLFGLVACSSEGTNDGNLTGTGGVLAGGAAGPDQATGSSPSAGGAPAGAGGSVNMGGVSMGGGAPPATGGNPGAGGDISMGGMAMGGTAGIGSGGDAAGEGGSPGGGGALGTGGGGGMGGCPHVQIRGTDICTIGDSWIQIPGNQVTTLENHMKMAGVIPEGDRFDRREVSGSTLSAIIDTYTRQPETCKILIMDGGGIDLFTTPVGNQGAITPVVQRFRDFLERVRTDGYVQHIIYSLYPVIPSTPNLNANMKPGFSEACEASAVDCHLVDLEPLFNGEHFSFDRTHADEAGGVIIGDAWWQAMQENCIAQ